MDEGLTSLADMIAPYMSAAAEVYGQSVLGYAADDGVATAAALGRRLLLRVFGPRERDKPLPEPLADFATDPANKDALAALRLAVLRALGADELLAIDVRSMVAAALSRARQVRPWRDALTTGDRYSPPQGLVADARRAAGRQLVVGYVPRQLLYFQPRPQLQAQLDRTGLRVSAVQVVTGMSGVGKTQLTAAYTRARLEEGWRLVAWVDAANHQSLQRDLTRIVDVIGLADKATGGKTDPGRLLRHWLEADGERCLVVFDGVTEPDALRPFTPRRGAARVIITTDKPSVTSPWPEVKVGGFSPEEARAFLVSRTAAADNEVDPVAAELGYLPIALAHAAATIRIAGLSYQTYLDQIRTIAEKNIKKKHGELMPHAAVKAIALSLSSFKASPHGDAYSRFFEFMAVFSGKGIRIDLAHAAEQMSSLTDDHGAEVVESRVNEVLTRLSEWSLLTPSLDGQTAAIHELTRQVSRHELVKQGRLMAVCRAAAMALKTYVETLAESQDYSAVQDISQQVSALQETAGGPDAERDDVLSSLLLRLRLWVLYHLYKLGGDPAQTILIGEPLTSDFERILGPDHPDTLASRNNLANAYREIGRAAEAVLLLEQTLAARERVLGPRHPFTLDTRNNLAAAYVDVGRTVEAISLHEQTLADREREFGSDHPETLQSRNNLAIAYQEGGRDAEAILNHEENLATRERLLGPEHPLTLASRNNLATAYHEAGWIAEAIPMYELVLAARGRMLGPDHPDTLASMNNLAVAYHEAGRRSEAVKLFEKTLAAYERLLGSDHPGTVASRNNLAAVKHISGNKKGNRN